MCKLRCFTVLMTGTWNGGQGTLDERFTYSDGKTERRVWKLTEQRVDSAQPFGCAPPS